MMMKFKGFAVLVLLQVIAIPLFSQKWSPPELLRIPFTSHHDKEQKNFYLYLPEGYQGYPEKKWPVILYLHGNGERGNSREDLDWLLAEGPLYEAWIQKRNLPFIIICPQMPMYGMDTVPYIRDRKVSNIPHRLDSGVPDRPIEYGTNKKMEPEAMTVVFPNPLPPAGWEREEKDVMDILERVIDEYHGDASRIYITGISYGGFGTWYLANQHPKVWAAMAPIVGWGHPDLVEPIAKYKIPIWVFAGGRDEGVELRYFYAGLNKLEALGHSDVRFTIEEDMNHDVWRRVYAGEDLYNWFLTKRKENDEK